MKRLLLLFCLALPVGAAGPPGAAPPEWPTADHEWAVLVGVSQYGSLPQADWLPGCDADARSFSEFLRSPRGGAFPASHVKLLLNQDATVRNVRLALDQVIKKVAPGDVVYLFFACHGRVDSYGSGDVGYLMLFDSDPEYLNATALPMDEVRRYVDLNLRAAGQLFLITDACHAGAMSPAPGADLTRLPRSTVGDHLLDMGERTGVLNLMACRRDESAVEDPDLGGHGVLTYTLLRGLSGEAPSDRSSTVRAQDLLEYVTRQVPRLTNNLQHPRHSSNYADEFPMARLDLPGPALVLPPPPGAPAGARDTFMPAALRVVGGSVGSDFYLLQGEEQRTVGRQLAPANALVLEGLRPGRYLLVRSAGAEQTRWSVELGPGIQSFDVGTGQLR